MITVKNNQLLVENLETINYIVGKNADGSKPKLTTYLVFYVFHETLRTTYILGSVLHDLFSVYNFNGSFGDIRYVMNKCFNRKASFKINRYGSVDDGFFCRNDISGQIPSFWKTDLGYSTVYTIRIKDLESLKELGSLLGKRNTITSIDDRVNYAVNIFDKKELTIANSTKQALTCAYHSGKLFDGYFDATDSIDSCLDNKTDYRVEKGKKNISDGQKCRNSLVLEAICKFSTLCKHQVTVERIPGIPRNMECNDTILCNLEQLAFQPYDDKPTLANAYLNIFGYRVNWATDFSSPIHMLWTLFSSVSTVNSVLDINRVLYSVVPLDDVKELPGLVSFIKNNVVKLDLTKVEVRDMSKISGNEKRKYSKEIRDCFTCDLMYDNEMHLFFKTCFGTTICKFSMDIFRLMFLLPTIEGDTRVGNGSLLRNRVMNRFMVDVLCNIIIHHNPLNGFHCTEYVDCVNVQRLLKQLQDLVGNVAREEEGEFIYKDKSKYEYYIWDDIITLQILQKYEWLNKDRGTIFNECIQTMLEFYDDLVCSLVISNLHISLEPPFRRKMTGRADWNTEIMTVDGHRVTIGWLSNTKSEEVENLNTMVANNDRLIAKCRPLVRVPDVCLIPFTNRGIMTKDDMDDYFIENGIDTGIKIINDGKQRLK